MVKYYYLTFSFREMEEDNFNIIAAASHPQFKLNWIEDKTLRNKAKHLLAPVARDLSVCFGDCLSTSFFLLLVFASEERSADILSLHGEWTGKAAPI